MGKYKHIPLPVVKQELPRNKRPPHRKKIKITKEERKAFSEIQLKNLAQIESSIEYTLINTLNLIFKIILHKDSNHKELRDFLQKNNVEILAELLLPDRTKIFIAKSNNLDKIRHKLEEYGKIEKYRTHFDYIENFQIIEPEEKIGNSLRENPLKNNEKAYIDVELWRMDEEDLNNFINIISEAFPETKITDKLFTKNLSLLKLKTNKEDLSLIIKFPEVANVDRPPKPDIILKTLDLEIDTSKNVFDPDENSPYIAILDSGVIPQHPLIKIAHENSFSVPDSEGNIFEENPYDDTGHGTAVAGIALYGDLYESIKNKHFKPIGKIISCKIMYRDETDNPAYDDSELFEHQLIRVVKYIVENFPECKIFNLSIGNTNKPAIDLSRQFRLASLLDELSEFYNIIFVVPSGNIREDFLKNKYEEYPTYYLDNSTETKIIDPATSMYSITVGSIVYPRDISFSQYHYEVEEKDILIKMAKTNEISPFSRVGPGFRGMIKPDLVEYGGNYILKKLGQIKMSSHRGKIIVLNKNYLEDIFSLNYGTSFAVPKVAHHLARIQKKFPDASINLLKALLISSAEIPTDLPEDMVKDSGDNIIHNFFGYGKPDSEKSIYSEDERVILFKEDTIKIDAVNLYQFFLPESFFKEEGKRKISITLVYNPPVNRNRLDYLGLKLKFKLYNEFPENIKKIIDKKYFLVEEENNTESDEKEINLYPGISLRSKGIHQKGVIEFDRKPRKLDYRKPFTIAVICQNNWIKEDFYQNFAIVVEISHKNNVNLYNQIRQQLQVKIRPR